ncbi:hypothetical protein GIB67_037485 [Kingdonia uniflora]|uniref:Uncharacterized protein n=1 Tax=Kingdonia uniflora TaxID=39325 RepID=A0A7J7KXA2_9MAGN|nr:hypothetical protein GIB67_037485 [Kingdonia uniflora]
MISEQLTRGLSSMASPDDLFALFSSLRGTLGLPDMIAMVDNQISWILIATRDVSTALGLKVDTQNVLLIDIMDPTCIASLASFLKIQFGRLDILVNNVGVTGVVMDPETLERLRMDLILCEKSRSKVRTNYNEVSSLSTLFL